MSISTHTPLPASEQLLPSEVTARSETWLTRARNYPVFSRTWFRYRAQAWLGMFAIVDIIALLFAWVVNYDVRKTLVVFIPFTIGATALHLLGPAMAIWVRNRAYTGKKEIVSLVTALVVGAVCSYGLFTVVGSATRYVLFGIAPVHFKMETSVESEVVTDKPLEAAAASKTAQAAAASPSTASNAKETTKNKLEDNSSLKIVTQAFSFILLSGLVIYTGGAVDLWYFFRQKKRLLEVWQQQELKAAQNARREAELRLSVLAAQVEPHFLFNTLAGVRSAILTEPQRATAIVDHLVDYLRATIPQMRSDGSSAQARLKQQLEAVSAYLGLMQARIPRLSYSVDSEVSDAGLPPLMLISLVENAVKHGVEPKIGPVHITVSAKKLQQADGNMLELTVADNGVGFSGVSSGSGIGLTNIHERLASMYGKRASLVLKARAEGGVAATILLPLEAE